MRARLVCNRQAFGYRSVSLLHNIGYHKRGAEPARAIRARLVCIRYASWVPLGIVTYLIP